METIHLSESQKKTAETKGVLIFEDEASFRQDPTLYRTWSKRGFQPLIPTTGQRNTKKIFGAINLYEEKFHWRRDTVFNSQTYIQFLNQVVDAYPSHREINLIHDNAAYHKTSEVQAWLADHRKRIHLIALPPYSPEFNATERVWHYLRIQATHNRYYSDENEFVKHLDSSLNRIQANTYLVSGYLQPFL